MLTLGAFFYLFNKMTIELTLDLNGTCIGFSTSIEKSRTKEFLQIGLRTILTGWKVNYSLLIHAQKSMYWR